MYYTRRRMGVKSLCFLRRTVRVVYWLHGHRRSDPSTRVMLSRDRQERFRERYRELHPSWRPSTHVYEALVVSHLNAGSRVLDLGCGRGGITERLHQQASLVVGIDPDWRSLREHREPSLALSCGFAGTLPCADAAFDVVCSSWVLEHLAEPGPVFQETARVLKRGGRFVFLTPNARHPLLILNRLLAWTEGRLVSRVYGRREDDVFPAYYRANSLARIEHLARQAGMTRVSLRLVGDPTYLAWNEAFFRVACVLERGLPRGMRVHLIGEYVVL